MPDAHRTRNLACEIKEHTSIVTTGSTASPTLPARSFYGFLRALVSAKSVFVQPKVFSSSKITGATSAVGDHPTGHRMVRLVCCALRYEILCVVAVLNLPIEI
jgi:hypothetical protein